jgi:hypothetical protein
MVLTPINMNNSIENADLTSEKLNLETGLIPWKQLQRFFATGQAISVATELDLVEVANAFSEDDKTQVETWLIQNKVSKVSDQQAINWIESDIEVWAVIVKPWVLVQETISSESSYIPGSTKS